MKSLLYRIYRILSSMRLTMVCLSAAMILVFAGTLAQVQLGIQIVQEHYFQSMFVWWPFGREDGFQIPVFPGGHLIGGVLLVNLVFAHIRHFGLSTKKIGSQLTHIGIMIMLAGGVFTDLFSVESYMRLDEGQTKNYSEEYGTMELALADVSDPAIDTVTAIPAGRLRKGELISHDSLPFHLKVAEFYPNSRVRRLGNTSGGATPASTRGAGRSVSISEAPRATKQDESDMVSAVIELIPLPEPGTTAPASLGTWLVSSALVAEQTVDWGGRTWRFALRPRRHYKDFSLTLHDFVHERYPGTQIPKNFSSRVTLSDPEAGVNRETLIYMNHPLRYGGETFYQSGFDRNEETSILQVVRNPGVATPYIACAVVSLGLLIQFGFHLVGFVRRNTHTSPS